MVDLFFVREGEKRVLHKRNSLALVSVVVSGLFLVTVMNSEPTQQGHSLKTDRPLLENEEAVRDALKEIKKVDDAPFVAEGSGDLEFEKSHSSTDISENKSPKLRKSVFQSSTSTSTSKSTGTRKQNFSPPPLKYQAAQVILRSGPLGANGRPNIRKSSRAINAIARLLTPLDTRDLNAMVEVILPYGAKINGEEFLEKNAILQGQTSYSGDGQRIYLNFHKAITSDGQEIPIIGQAMDSKDYRRGILGEVHSERGVRVASTLGLTMLSGMTEVMTEKMALGQVTEVTPKSTFKNALFNGTSKVADREAGRQAEEMAQTPSYVTVDMGRDLIVNLSEDRQ